MRSTWLKLIAFLLCICCVGGAVYPMFYLLCTGQVTVYNFENNPKERLAENLNFALHLAPGFEDPWVQQRLKDLNVHYYFQYDDKVYQNDPDLLDTYTQSEFYIELSKENGCNGLTVEDYYINTEELDGWSDYRFIVQYPNDYVEEFKVRWNNEKDWVNTAILFDLVCMVIALLALVYLFWVCGRNGKDEQVHLLLIDRVFVEFTLGAAILIVAAMIAVVVEASYSFGSIAPVFALLFAVLCVGSSAAVIGLLLSLVRNLKNKTFLQRSLIYRILRWCWRLIRKVVKFIGGIRMPLSEALHHKTGKTAVVGLAGYTLFLCFCMLFVLGGSFFFFLLLVAGCVGACWWVARCLVDFEKVKNGIFAIRNGAIDYKIVGVKDGLMGALATAVNSLGEGLRLSLEKEVRAERMKSELITNVSHDLKTPLTSIINYSDLLCKEELTPAEANDYARIISQKSQRLKKLTSDLFDISKVQSGTEQINREQLDLKILVEQALAEIDEAASQSELEWVVSLEEHVLVWGDGKKLSRALENLLTNVMKYAMKHTRVYVTAKQNGEVTIKNISAYPMNFDEEEITERFVRGDAARSTEGSGLGLAIAKSYTEACGGTLSVKVDGDLFKVTMRFEPVNE